MIQTTCLKKNPNSLEQYDQKCVCQICTCGKHHCPPKNVPLQAETTNSHYYKPYKVVPDCRKMPQQEYVERHYNPEVLTSSYKSEYEPHHIQPHLKTFKTPYTPQRRPFYGQTEYNHHYSPKHVQISQHQKPLPSCYVKNKARFEGKSTYNEQFSPKQIQPMRPVTIQYERPYVPFTGESVYDSEFKAFQIQRRRPNTGKQELPMRRNKFMGESRYREEYKPYQVIKKEICPVEVLPQRPNRCSPGKNHLNYSAQKRRWE